VDKLKRLTLKLLLALGDASYSIYLSHLFTLGVLRVAWVRVFAHATLVNSIAFMAVALIACASAGWLCYRFVESPMTRILKQLPAKIDYELCRAFAA
jgi:exopolysaccharide production protein ExoZ